MTSLALPRPGTARGAAFGQIVRNEARLAWRRPVALVAGALLPVVLLVILGELPRFLQDSMLRGFPPVAPLLVLAGYAVVFGFLARHFFRWE